MHILCLQEIKYLIRALMPREASCRPRSPFSDLLAVPKYPETQPHVQTYINRLVCESFNHPGHRSRDILNPRPLSLLPPPLSLCPAMPPTEHWGKGADALEQVGNEQEGERKSRVMGGRNYLEGRKPPCETQLWHLK